jgi:hypothetical protein
MSRIGFGLLLGAAVAILAIDGISAASAQSFIHGRKGRPVARPAATLEAGQSSSRLYFRAVEGTSCAGTLFCEMTFPAVPAGKRLLIRTASCYAALQDVGSIVGIGLVQGDIPVVVLKPVRNTNKEFSATEPVLFPVSGGTTPVIRIGAIGANFSAIICSLAGDILKED